MSIADNIRIKQQFDPEGENGGYRCDSGLEKSAPTFDGSTNYLAIDLGRREVYTYTPNPSIGIGQPYKMNGRTVDPLGDVDGKVIQPSVSKNYQDAIARNTAKRKPDPDAIAPQPYKINGRMVDPLGDVDAKSGLTATEKAELDAKAQRQVGKVAALAAGYGGGQAAIRALDEDANAPLDVKLNTALEDLQRYCRADTSGDEMTATRLITKAERDRWLEGQWAVDWGVDRDDFSVAANRRRYIKG